MGIVAERVCILIYGNINVRIVFDAAPLDRRLPYICICIFVYLCICVHICIFVFDEAPLGRRRPYKVELEPDWRQKEQCPCTCNFLPIDKNPPTTF